MEKHLRAPFNVRINADIHRRAYNASLAEGVSLNQFVQKAIEKQLSE
jgi:predicted HicB family RNase H-like nuclease